MAALGFQRASCEPQITSSCLRMYNMALLARQPVILGGAERAARPRAGRPSARDGQQAPLAAHALEQMRAGVLEDEARSRDEIHQRPRRKHASRIGDTAD